MIHMNCVQIAGCEWSHGNIKGKFSKNYSKIFSSEAIRGMKLKLCIHVHDISLYINCVFILLLYSGKLEIGIYFCVTADILTNVLLKCFWSSRLPTIWILSKSLILIGCHGNQRLNFRKKKYSKIFFLRIHKGDEADTLHKCSWH